MATRTLAMDAEGNMSYCTVPVEQRGTHGCTHIGHMSQGQSNQDFVKECEEIMIERGLIPLKFDDPIREDDDSDEFYQAKKDFNDELNEYDPESVFDEEDKEEFQQEIVNRYGVSDLKVIDKAIRFIGMSRGSAEGEELPSGRSFEYYGSDSGTAGMMVPEFKNYPGLVQALSSYAYNSIGDGESIAYPKSLKAAEDIMDDDDEPPFEIEDMREDKRYIVK